MKTPEHPIFLKSVKYIRSQLGLTGLGNIQQSILERIVHSSGDLSLHSLLRFSTSACEKGIKSLKNGAKIITDTYMAQAAIAPMAKRTIHSDIQCILGMAPDSINSDLITRSEIGMRNTWLDLEEKDQSLHDAPIVVIGSSPTALIALLDLIEAGHTIPSLIIGMPVGFIGVTESKTRLLNSHLSYIVLDGSKGGASIAAATVNALLRGAEN